MAALSLDAQFRENIKTLKMCLGTYIEQSDVLELNSIMAFLSSSLHSTNSAWINIDKHVQ